MADAPQAAAEAPLAAPAQTVPSAPAPALPAATPANAVPDGGVATAPAAKTTPASTVNSVSRLPAVADDGWRTAVVDGVEKRWRLDEFELLETLGACRARQELASAARRGAALTPGGCVRVSSVRALQARAPLGAST